MNTVDAKRVLETALICAQQPVPVRELRVLFNDALGSDTLKLLLQELQQGHNFDIVVLCSQMEDMSSIEFMMELRKLEHKPLLMLFDEGRRKNSSALRMEDSGSCCCVERIELKNLLRELYRMPGQYRPQLPQCRTDHFFQRLPVQPQLDPATLQAGHVEQVADQPVHLRCLTMDGVRQFLLRRVSQLFFQRARQPGNGGDRGTQIV